MAGWVEGRCHLRRFKTISSPTRRQTQPPTSYLHTSKMSDTAPSIHMKKQAHVSNYNNSASAKQAAIAANVAAGKLIPPNSTDLLESEPKVLVTAPVKPNVPSVVAVVLVVMILVLFFVARCAVLVSPDTENVNPVMLEVEIFRYDWVSVDVLLLVQVVVALPTVVMTGPRAVVTGEIEVVDFSVWTWIVTVSTTVTTVAKPVSVFCTWGCSYATATFGVTVLLC